KGTVKLDGPARQVANSYLHSGAGNSAVRVWPDLKQAPGDEVVRLRAVRVKTEAGDVSDSFDIRHPVGIEMEYEVLKSGFIFHPHFALKNEEGDLLFVAQDMDREWRAQRRPAGRYVSTSWIPGNFLAEGAASVHFNMMSLAPEARHIEEDDVVQFRVIDCLEAKDTSRGEYMRPIPGLIRPMLHWTTQYFPTGKMTEAATR
ncbi:MAG: ABC transporter ATP-binding protein, partial [Verrucomicrobiota bacterium]